MRALDKKYWERVSRWQVPIGFRQLKAVHLKAVMVVVAAFSNGTTCKATILLQLPDFALKFRFILKAIVTG
jgi:hypothetical protein